MLTGSARRDGGHRAPALVRAFIGWGLNYELWVGDPAQIRAKRGRKQRNDRFDAQHILKLMLENNFPRIWVPTPENRDVRQLVLNRDRLVGMRTRVMNQLQAIAMHEGARRKARVVDGKGTGAVGVVAVTSLEHSAPAFSPAVLGLD